MLQIFSIGRKSIKNTLSIYIKSNNGRTLTVDLEPQWDILNVKKIVAPQLGLQPNEFKIIFAGKQLSDHTTIEECDLGQQSVLHAIPMRKTGSSHTNRTINTLPEEECYEEQPSKPLCETLTDLEIEQPEKSTENVEASDRTKAHFFVHCGQCKKLCRGKLRVRCSVCKYGAFTVYSDPKCWDDVLKTKRIRGYCESSDSVCNSNNADNNSFAEFYFKCAEHTSGGEKDFAAPLNLVKINSNNIPCLACTEISDKVLVFPCASKHVICIQCFVLYCHSRLMERKFIVHSTVGYSLPCPIQCENSLIEEAHHFKLLTTEDYERYQRFATEEFVLQAGGVLCPQPNCGMGLLVDPDCQKVACQNGCGYVFCRYCLQGYHIGDCLPEKPRSSDTISNKYLIDPKRAAESRWDEATNVTIKATTKPCPKCRTPTEKSGGCSHMVCSRQICNFEWCWICQTEWTRDCMGTHWFD